MRVIDTAIRNRAKTTAPMRVLLAERRYSLERSFLPMGFEASPEKSAINLTHFLREKKQWQSLTYRITLSVKGSDSHISGRSRVGIYITSQPFGSLCQMVQIHLFGSIFRKFLLTSRLLSSLLKHDRLRHAVLGCLSQKESLFRSD